MEGIILIVATGLEEKPSFRTRASLQYIKTGVQLVSASATARCNVHWPASSGRQSNDTLAADLRSGLETMEAQPPNIRASDVLRNISNAPRGPAGGLGLLDGTTRTELVAEAARAVKSISGSGSSGYCDLYDLLAGTRREETFQPYFPGVGVPASQHADCHHLCLTAALLLACTAVA
jgi:hypothetical protein